MKLYMTVIAYKSSFILSEPNLGLTVADGRLQIQQKFLGGQLLCVDLAHIRLQLVDLLDLGCDGWLEQTLQLRGLISDVGLQYLRVILEVGDLALDQFAEVQQVRSVLVEGVTQKSTHLLHAGENT